MRIRFDEQLKQLNKEMINMGTMIEESIGDAVKALMKQDVELAQKVMAIVQKEKLKIYAYVFYYSSSQ